MASPTAHTENGVDRLPVTVRFDESALYTETYGYAGSQGIVLLEGQALIPKDRPSNTLLVFMHPASSLSHLPLPNALAEAGIHVMCCGSRYAKNDTALIMEKVATDLGAYIRHAKEELGYEKVVLGGWSGGGSLSLFYQAEAEHPTIKSTPAGEPVDLTAAGLIPADAVMLLAAHLSRAKTLAEWIDPANPNQAPYGLDYVAQFRAAQLERSRRISSWVLEQLDTLKRRDNGEFERAFVVHRTMADPRWLDPALDPNDRKPGWCYLGDPRTVNVGPVGLARFSTLRSWLSQWSYDHSRADGPGSAARISVPLLMVENSADDAVPASHFPQIEAAAVSANQERHVIAGATHYYANQPKQLAQAAHVCIDWLQRNAFID